MMFWVAISVLQLDEVSLYASGLALLEQNLHTLDSQGMFDNKSLEHIMMSTREPLEWHFKQLDHAVGLSFKSKLFLNNLGFVPYPSLCEIFTNFHFKHFSQLSFRIGGTPPERISTPNSNYSVSNNSNTDHAFGNCGKTNEKGQV